MKENQRFCRCSARCTGAKVTEAADELEVPEDSARRWMTSADPDAGRCMNGLRRPSAATRPAFQRVGRGSCQDLALHPHAAGFEPQFPKSSSRSGVVRPSFRSPLLSCACLTPRRAGSTGISSSPAISRGRRPLDRARLTTLLPELRAICLDISCAHRWGPPQAPPLEYRTPVTTHVSSVHEGAGTSASM